MGSERTVVFISAVTGHGGPNASLRVLLSHLSGMDRVLLGPYGDVEAAAWRQAGVDVRLMPRPLGARRLIVAAWTLVRELWRLRRRRPLVFANGLTEAVVVAPAILALRLQGFVWVHNSEVPRIARILSPLLRRLAWESLPFRCGVCRGRVRCP